MRRGCFSAALMILGLALIWAAMSCSVLESTKIEKAVVQALAEDERTKAYTFDVSYQEGGTVLITGEVSSLATVDAITEIAMAVDGVDKVLNRCNVPEEGNGLLQDTTVPSPYF